MYGGLSLRMAVMVTGVVAPPPMPPAPPAPPEPPPPLSFELEQAPVTPSSIANIALFTFLIASSRSTSRVSPVPFRSNGQVHLQEQRARDDRVVHPGEP